MKNKKLVVAILAIMCLLWPLQAEAAAKTGWQQTKQGWYYLNQGVSLTGWRQVGNAWYYLGHDGVMKSGWQKLGGAWYYLGGANDGSMKSGWQKLGGAWYYLGGANDGSMKSEWQQIRGTWYYLGGANDGSMKSGWQQVRGAWYYLGDKNDGAMWASCWVGDYYVGENGAWIPGYSETKDVAKVSLIRQNGSAEHDKEKIETDKREAIEKVTGYVRGLQKADATNIEEVAGGGFAIRLDYVDGTHQTYNFFYGDMQGNLIVLSNGKYFYYQQNDLNQLWKALGGTDAQL
ncbi:MAG: hypothetical protein Q4P30_03740 [Eubacteriales bacterium]|nr:hypothetical protein [Eubacteriales bacterium]